MSSTSKKQKLAAAVAAAFVLLLPVLAFTAACPVCGGRVVKTAMVSDDTNAPSRNLCVWNRSTCANLLYGSRSVVCTRCWHARSEFLGKWERASESPSSFQKPLSSVIRGVPVPSADSVRSRVVFTQTYAKKRFAESVAFGCVDSESVLSCLRGYCAANRLTFSAETNRMPGQVYVKIE